MKTIATWLRWIADLLDEPQKFVLITPAIRALEKHAEFAVKQVQEKFSEMEGEFKGAQAYRMMLNIHPEADKSDIKMALELAVKKCLGR